MLTIQWQELTPGWATPSRPRWSPPGWRGGWRQAVERAEAAWAEIRPDLPEQPSTWSPWLHRVRLRDQLNAREALHMIELRTRPQGHPSYAGSARRCSSRSTLWPVTTGWPAMSFAGREDVHLPRYAPRWVGATEPVGPPWGLRSGSKYPYDPGTAAHLRAGGVV